MGNDGWRKNWGIWALTSLERQGVTTGKKKRWFRKTLNINFAGFINLSRMNIPFNMCMWHISQINNYLYSLNQHFLVEFVEVVVNILVFHFVFIFCYPRMKRSESYV